MIQFVVKWNGTVVVTPTETLFVIIIQQVVAISISDFIVQRLTHDLHTHIHK